MLLYYHDLFVHLDCMSVIELMICLQDPFLHLIGLSRAIMFTDKVCIEIELCVNKGGTDFQNKLLISCARDYKGGNPGMSTIYFSKQVFALLYK